MVRRRGAEHAAAAAHTQRRRSNTIIKRTPHQSTASIKSPHIHTYTTVWLILWMAGSVGFLTGITRATSSLFLPNFLSL